MTTIGEEARTFCVFLSRMPFAAMTYPDKHNRNTSKIDCVGVKHHEEC